MVTTKEDSKIINIESPKVTKENPNNILDDALESVGLKRDSGGSA